MEGLEIWEDINGYKDWYKVSNKGNVKSLSRQRQGNGKKGLLKERVLKPTLNGDGYPCVKLYKDGKKKSFKVHILVADAFLTPDPERSCINHKDGVKSNNNVLNLERCTHTENMIHAFENGLNKTKLNINIPCFIKMVNEGMSAKDIALELKCSTTTVRNRAKKYNLKLKRGGSKDE